MDLKDFKRRRDMLAAQYEEISKIAANLKAVKLREALQTDKAELLNGKFKLVVVGEFSRGKSTFINALLGRRLLPSSTKPTTAVITKLEYAEQPAFEVNYYKNYPSESISEERFHEIVAGAEPDAEEKELAEYEKWQQYLQEIACINIKYPLELCHDGVELVDTPGVNDLNEAREEITLSFIPQADAALFLLDATQILSESEMNFLRDRVMGNDIQKIFFIVSKADKLHTADEKERVIAHARTHLAPVVAKPRLYAVSARDALNFKRVQAGETTTKKGKPIKAPATLEETGFRQLETDISSYLATERGYEKLAKFCRRSNKYIERLQHDFIAVRISTAGIGAAEMEKKVASLQPELLKTKRQAKQILDAFRIKLINLKEELIVIYQNGHNTAVRSIYSSLDNYDGSITPGVLKKFVQKLAGERNRDFSNSFNSIRQEKLTAVAAECNQKLRTIWSELDASICRELMLVTDNNLEEMDEISAPSICNEEDESDLFALGAGIYAAAAFGGPIGIAAAIAVKMFWPQKSAEERKANRRLEMIRSIKSNISNVYEKRLRKGLDDFNQNYESATQSMLNSVQHQVDSRVFDMENQLNSLIEEKRRAQIDAEREIAAMQECQFSLKKIAGIVQEVQQHG